MIHTVFAALIVSTFLKMTGPEVSDSWICDENNMQIAKVKNASISEIAFASFESPTSGYWNYTGAISGGPMDKGRTGYKYYSLSAGAMSRSNLPKQRYVVSFWSKDGTATLTGTNFVQYRRSNTTINGWVFSEILCYLSLAGSSITLSGDAKVDDVRLYPSDALMTNLTYDYMVGITSESNESGFILFYEYDNFNRLKLIKDQHGNIVRTYHYTFKN